ncbi:hypothetical protein [Halosolutus gelatinilyticus]|nr:hypothetical protein [Halosolutus gelatinilyticus]
MRSLGRLEPESISEWTVTTRRVVAGMMATMALLSIYLALFEL